jgi:peptidyl-tRNA hydrolase
VGRPKFDTIDHVLSPFSADETKALPSIVEAAAEGAELWLASGIERSMQYVNNWKL